jgi:enoyl-CoA hydratase/carnithine racemase
MSPSTDIAVTVSDLVASVEIRRPPHNFFDHALIRQIADAYEALDEDPTVRAIVLCSQGTAFCAGADFASRQSWSPDALQEQAGQLYREAVRLFRARTPVVAAVQGAAVGGGLGLCLSADFRVASTAARFSANFARLGLYPGFGITVTLPRAVGHSNAELMLLTGRRVKGEEALAMGLVQECVEPAALRQVAENLAREIALSAPLSVDALRTQRRQRLAEEVARATEHELEVQTRLKATADFAEGVKAMSERRRPDFTGR